MESSKCNNVSVLLNALIGILDKGDLERIDERKHYKYPHPQKNYSKRLFPVGTFKACFAYFRLHLVCYQDTHCVKMFTD